MDFPESIDRKSAPCYTETISNITRKGNFVSKFVIRTVSSGIKFDLNAANGESIATSEVYKNEASCRKGIESVRKNAPIARIENQTEPGWKKMSHPKFEMYRDRAGAFRFRLKARNGEIVAISEGYTTKAGCLDGIDSVQRNAPSAEVVEA